MWHCWEMETYCDCNRWYCNFIFNIFDHSFLQTQLRVMMSNYCSYTVGQTKLTAGLSSCCCDPQAAVISNSLIICSVVMWALLWHQTLVSLYTFIYVLCTVHINTSLSSLSTSPPSSLTASVFKMFLLGYTHSIILQRPHYMVLGQSTYGIPIGLAEWFWMHRFTWWLAS